MQITSAILDVVDFTAKRAGDVPLQGSECVHLTDSQAFATDGRILAVVNSEATGNPTPSEPLATLTRDVVKVINMHRGLSPLHVERSEGGNHAWVISEDEQLKIVAQDEPTKVLPAVTDPRFTENMDAPSVAMVRLDADMLYKIARFAKRNASRLKFEPVRPVRIELTGDASVVRFSFETAASERVTVYAMPLR